jgi:hypothetical protein
VPERASLNSSFSCNQTVKHRPYLSIFIGLALLVAATTVRAQFVPSSEIANDPAKVKLCISRLALPGKVVPFIIDKRYVEMVRATNPDTVFVAVDGASPQLVECHLRQGTGRFEPASYAPEQAHWQLHRPPQHRPSINTREGMEAATRVCLAAIQKTFGTSGSVSNVPLDAYEAATGRKIGGKSSERYDVEVTIRTMYTAKGPDLAVRDVTCLLSPMFELKAIQSK